MRLRLLLASTSLFILAITLTLGDVPLPNTDSVTLSSKATGRTYAVTILLPSDYSTSHRRYPVLYVTDGRYNQNLVRDTEVELITNKQLPDLITVCIDYDKVTEQDLSPMRETDFLPANHADKTLDFLEDQLIPYIDHQYRTKRYDRALLGHSYGGVFAIYVLMERPRLFQKIIAVSPSLFYDQGVMLKRAQAIFASDHRYETRLDLSLGGSEVDPVEVGAPQALKKILDLDQPRGLVYRFTLYPDQTHISVKDVSFEKGLAWLYSDE